jgi:hypothetical protein
VEKQINYALEEFNPSDHEQHIRTPAEVLKAPCEGTCLDLATLFCGLCLGNELLPILIVLQDHALAAVSLKHDLRGWEAIDRTEKSWFKSGILTDPNKLRSLLDSGAYIAIECTGFAHSEKLAQTPTTSPAPPECGQRQKGALPFERAMAAGREQLDFTPRPFQFALDIAILHNRWGIKPALFETQVTKIKATNKGIAVGTMHGSIYQYNNPQSDQEQSMEQDHE